MVAPDVLLFFYKIFMCSPEFSLDSYAGVVFFDPDSAELAD